MILTRVFPAIALVLLLGVSVLAVPAVEDDTIADLDIADAIENEYLFDFAVDPNKIDVRVNEGIVELTGTAENLLAKERATYIAKRVKGVRSVSNRIEVKPSGQRSAAELRRAVKDALFEDSGADSYEIDVDVTGGFVTLSGTVESFAEKRLSERVAKGVRGVTGIDNKIEIEYEASRPDAEIKPDSEIAKAIKDAALYDPRVISTRVDPDVRKGLVTLRGEVASLRAKRAAGQLARDTVGVNGVTNRLMVRPLNEPTDSEIESNIKTSLFGNPFTDSYRIGVSVYNGNVTLTGTVDSSLEKTEAELVASSVSGASEVFNFLRVSDEETPRSFGYRYPWYTPSLTPQDYMSGEEIKDAVEDELWSSPFVVSGQIRTWPWKMGRSR